MSGIDDLLKDIPIPRLARAAQVFERRKVADVETELLRGLAEKRVFAALPSNPQGVPAPSVAVALGSRGISGLPEVARLIVRELKAAGARPFVVPAMGSHGGATAEGQKALLEHLGLGEDATGAPIRSSMEVAQVAVSPRFGLPVLVDAEALKADGIVIVNRVKAHAAYAGAYESGLVKMVTIGLGKQRQAEICHNAGAERIGEFIADIGLEALKHIRLLAAVGLVENAFHETARLAVLRREEIEGEEPALLAEAKALAARFHIDEFEVLIIDEIGKEISGAGFDTTIVGRYSSPYLSGGPRIRRVAVLDITGKSKGYGGGLGMVDFTTRRAVARFDPEQTYPNTLTSTLTEGVKIPMVLKNDRQALQACIRTCNRMDYRQARVMRIRNTLCMEELEVSENLLDAVRAHPRMRVLSEPYELRFDAEGNLEERT